MKYEVTMSPLMIYFGSIRPHLFFRTTLLMCSSYSSSANLTSGELVENSHAAVTAAAAAAAISRGQSSKIMCQNVKMKLALAWLGFKALIPPNASASTWFVSLSSTRGILSKSGSWSTDYLLIQGFNPQITGSIPQQLIS